MKLAIKSVVAVLIEVVSLLVWLRFVAGPFRCNRVVRRVEIRSRAALQNMSQSRAATVGRENMLELQRVADRCPCNVDVYMLLGVNAKIRNQPDLAIRYFTDALHADERPEIYYNRGVTLLEVGQVDAAEADFVKAIRFNPNLLDQVEGYMRQRVEAKLRSST